MTVLEVLAGLSIAGGAVGGAVLGFAEYGAAGAALGLPAGAVLGWVVFVALPVLAVVGVVAIFVRIKHGPRAARRFVWGRCDDPPGATSPGG
ncbi:MAG: hypothetical protein J0I06_09420 [Planctomycetes bacterium]|nr:hypothetical protein [Planctomycetota bacterium]